MKTIGVAILGFGTVGAGVAKGLLENRAVLRERTGLDIELRRVADLDTTTDRGVAPSGTSGEAVRNEGRGCQGMRSQDRGNELRG